MKFDTFVLYVLFFFKRNRFPPWNQVNSASALSVCFRFPRYNLPDFRFRCIPWFPISASKNRSFPFSALQKWAIPLSAKLGNPPPSDAGYVSSPYGGSGYSIDAQKCPKYDPRFRGKLLLQIPWRQIGVQNGQNLDMLSNLRCHHLTWSELNPEFFMKTDRF